MRLIIFILLFPIISFSQDNETLIAQADSLLFTKDFKNSIPIYNKLLSSDSNNEKYLRGRGYAYFQSLEFEKANADYENAVSQNDTCLNCYINLTRINLALQKPEKAMEHANQAVKMKDKNGFGLLVRGLVYYNLNENVDAMFDISESIELNNKNAESYYYRAFCYNSLKFKDKAISDIKTAVKLKPTAETYYGVSRIYNINEMFKEAIPYLDSSIALVDNNSLYYRDIASDYAYLQQFKKANYNYLKAIEHGGNKEELYSFVASGYYQLENMDSSCYYLEKSLAEGGYKDKESIESYDDHCDTAQPNFYYQRGIAFYNLRDFEKSIEYHELGLKKFPKNSWLWNFHGNSLMANKNYSQAIESYKKSIQFYSDKNYRQIESLKLDNASESFKFSALFSIADCFLNLNQLDSAMIYINKAEKRALRMKSAENGIYASSVVANLKGDYFYRKAELDEAIKFYSKSVDLNPRNVLSRYKRAMLYFGRNDTKIEKYRTVSLKLSTNFEHYEYVNHSTQASSTKSKSELSLALMDCDYIIKNDLGNAKVYFLRALLKKELGNLSYCIDIQKAIELGMVDANQIANLNCKN